MTADELVAAGVSPDVIRDPSLPSYWQTYAAMPGMARSRDRHGGPVYERHDIQARAEHTITLAERLEALDAGNECPHGSLPSDRRIRCRCFDVIVEIPTHAPAELVLEHAA